MKNGDFPVRYVSHYQRVICHIKTNYTMLERDCPKVAAVHLSFSVYAKMARSPLLKKPFPEKPRKGVSQLHSQRLGQGEMAMMS